MEGEHPYAEYVKQDFIESEEKLITTLAELESEEEKLSEKYGNFLYRFYTFFFSHYIDPSTKTGMSSIELLQSEEKAQYEFTLFKGVILGRLESQFSESKNQENIKKMRLLYTILPEITYNEMILDMMQLHEITKKYRSVENLHRSSKDNLKKLQSSVRKGTHEIKKDITGEIADNSNLEKQNLNFSKWLTDNGFKYNSKNNTYVSQNREIIISFSNGMVTAIKTPIGGQISDILSFIKHFDRNGFRNL